MVRASLADMEVVFVPQITQVETNHDSYYLQQIIELPPSLIPKFDLKMLRSDMKYFVENRSKLMQDPNLKNKYVAIHNGKVIGYDVDGIDLTKKMYKEHGYIPILVRKLDSDNVHRVYSPHMR